MIAGCALALVASAHLRADVDPVQQPLGTVAPHTQHKGTLAPHTQHKGTLAPHTRHKGTLQHEAESHATSGYDIATVTYSGEGAGGCKASTVRTYEADEAGAEQSAAGRQLSTYIAVLSRPQNRDQRDAIRQTWKGQVDSDPSVEVRFVFCDKVMEQDRDHFARSAEENASFGDIQVLDCWEGYGHGNLTLKVYAAMKWFVKSSQNKTGPTVFMKVDDDTLIRAGEILEVARRTSSEAADFYMGKMHRESPVDRDPKSQWYEPCEVFKGSKYPTTASGAAYALSGSLVKRFVHRDITAVRERVLWNEDRAVATWVHSEIAERHIPVTYVNLQGLVDLSCKQEDSTKPPESDAMDDWRNLGLLVVHKMYPEQMRCVWQRMQREDPHAADCAPRCV